jgi:hypothetical protein
LGGEHHAAILHECIDLFASGSAIESDLVGDVELGIGDANEEHTGGKGFGDGGLVESGLKVCDGCLDLGL